jgi:hypothetical protein
MTQLDRVTLESQEVVMLKRTVVRLLMFGVPFCLSYILARPATPAAPAQTFVICAYGEQGQEITISTAKAGCSQNKGRSSGGIVPAIGQPNQNFNASTPSPRTGADTTSDILF